MHKTRQTRLAAFAAATAFAAIGCGDLETGSTPSGSGNPSVETTESAITAAPSRALDPNTRFFIPAPSTGAVQQVLDLAKHRKLVDAAHHRDGGGPARRMVHGRHARRVKAAVRKTVKAAALLKTVPVLVAYNFPSATARSTRRAARLTPPRTRRGSTASRPASATRTAVVILEPDGLGIIPYNSTSTGNAEWCKPTAGAGRCTGRPGDRYAQLNYAVDQPRRKAPAPRLPRRHAQRLAGRGESRTGWCTPASQRAQGFFLNVSNYQFTPTIDQVRDLDLDVPRADCGHADAGGAWWSTDWGCASQYVETPAGSGTVFPTTAPRRLTVDGDYAARPGWTAAPSTHFVVDTSRNGRGPLDGPPTARRRTTSRPASLGALHARQLVQPAGCRPGAAPDREHRGPAARRVPLGEGAGRVRRLVRHRGRRPRLGLRRYNPWG